MLYVYCIASRETLLTTEITGLAGERVNTIVVEDLAVVASNFEGDLVPVTRENVLLHDRVIRTLLQYSTPLPFRYGTLISDERLRNYLHTRLIPLREKLNQVRECVEMSVKIISRPETDKLESQKEDESKTNENLGIGARFLIARQREFREETVQTQHADEIRSWLETLVKSVVENGLTSIQPGKRLILSAAHLVKRKQLESYRNTISAGQKARPELHFLLSGPWAPYSFSNIALEFESHFGVS